MIQKPTLFKRLRNHRALSVLALFAMWIQVLAFCLHLVSTANAAAGAQDQGEFFGIICTANGLAAVPFDGHDSPATLEKDCAICAISAINDLGIDGDAQPFDRPVHAVSMVFWPTSPSDSTLSLSPRVGTSRAPPLL
nr:hypothetical protein [uncultured Cohaesibacter sp.]